MTDKHEPDKNARQWDLIDKIASVGIKYHAGMHGGRFDFNWMRDPRRYLRTVIDVAQEALDA